VLKHWLEAYSIYAVLPVGFETVFSELGEVIM
jgi:hypothetical protein